MKRILITGVNSYVGNSFANWMKQYPEDYELDKISLRDGSWRDMDFSNYDSILHVAGIAHRKETKKNLHLYYEVNRDITEEVACKAKNEGVSHLVFLSSMSVYGLTEGVINKDTPLKPKNNYGKSKLQAEKIIENIYDEKFKTTILRPPMIYGKKCPGNYNSLRKLVLKMPIFPDFKTRRSMIYIDNLSEYIKKIIENETVGIFVPQNTEFVSISDLVKKISYYNSHKIRFIKAFNKFITSIPNKNIQKLFGDLYYLNHSTENVFKYNYFSFDESIKLTEKGSLK